mmetsp:Transcript_21047/g.32273  ORF Transcript_21047/g.32273 Transcript_21047/m.32273 type:complete len:513 (-) Transcript_21047:349-1887(-)
MCPMVTPHPKRGKKVSSRRFDALGSSGPPKRVEAGTRAPALLSQYSLESEEKKQEEKKCCYQDFVMEFSKFGRRLKRSPIRAVTLPAMQRKAAGHDVKMLAGGLPHEDNFPIKSMIINDQLELSYLNQGLQYHSGAGLTEFREEMLELLAPFHNLQNLSIDHICGTTGCTDGLSKAVELLTEEGDEIFVEDLTWPGFLAIAKARGRFVKPVKMDPQYGLDPEALEFALRNRQNSRKQPLLYTVPSGHNPTGVTVSEERKKLIYQICQKYNAIILEDDPYFFLAMDGQLPVSYLSMDTDNRVIRLDSFAKIFAPGLRLGVVIAPPAYIQKFLIANEQTCQFPCGLAQITAIALLRDWKKSKGGFSAHLTKLQTEYLRRRDILVHALKNQDAHHNVLDFTIPSHGMFLFIKQSIFSNADEFAQLLTQADVAVVPGSCFEPTFGDDDDLITIRGGSQGDGKYDDDNDPTDSITKKPCPFFRITFATASDEHLVQAATTIVSLLANIPQPPPSTPP